MYFRLKAEYLLLLLVCIASPLLFFSCDSDSRKQSAIIPEEETIAVINNKKITLAEFQARLYAFLQYYRDLITTEGKQLEEIKSIVINQLIDEELINQEASRKGIQVPEEELESIIAESMPSYSKANFESYVKNSGLTEEVWQTEFRQHLVQKKLIQEEVIDNIPITKREIKSYYNDNSSEFIIPQALRVRNITLSTEEEANAILSQLLRGKNFKELIRHHSISPDKVLDGDLGFVGRGDLPEEMENAIFGKKFNTFEPRYTDVIRSQDGYHILKLESYRPERKESLENARLKIKQILVEQKWDQYYTQWIDKLRSEATISIDRTMLQKEEGF